MKIPVKVGSYLSLPKSEAVLKKYVALKGPVAVGKLFLKVLNLKSNSL